MRLDILDRGHRPRTKAVLSLIRLVSRQPVVDAVKLALYRPDFYGGGPLTHEAMRGPSEWSVGDRELMAAFVSQVNECPFCVAAHSATSTQWYGDHAKVAATLADVETAPIEDALAVCLAFNITNRLADTFDFTLASPEAMNAGARHLLKRGYRRAPG